MITFSRCVLNSFKQCNPQKGNFHTSTYACIFLRNSLRASDLNSSIVDDQRECRTFEDVLVNIGFEKRFIDSLFLKKPNLRNNSPQTALKCCDLFLSHGLKPSDLKEVVTGSPDVLTIKPETLSDIIETWRGFRLDEKDLFYIFRKCPRVLCLAPEYLSKRLQLISSKFSQRQETKLIKNCPEVFLQSWGHVLEVMDYVKEQMGLEEADIAKSKCFIYPLEHIKARHEFLKRTAAYETPTPKKRHVLNNPSLVRIVETSDEDFVKITRLTVEEYQVFCQLLEKESNFDDDFKYYVIDEIET